MGAPRERVQAAGAIADAARARRDPRNAAVPAAPRLSESLPDAELRKMLWPIEQRLGRARQELAKELGLDPPMHEHPTSEDSADAMARLRESGGEAHRKLDHVFEVAIAEARSSRSLQYLGWCLFRPKSWGAKIRGSAADAARKSKPTGPTPRDSRDTPAGSGSQPPSQPPGMVKHSPAELAEMLALAKSVAADPVHAADELEPEDPDVG